MGEETRAARQEVLAARAVLSGEVDELGSAARSAVDIPAKIRRKPLQTLGLATGAAFLVAGGPKRLVRAAERRFFPSRAERAKSYLPKDLAKAIDSLGEDATKARERIEGELGRFLERRAPDAEKEAKKLVGARQSFWKTYDAVLVPVSAVATKKLLDKLFAADPERTVTNVQPADEGKGPTSGRSLPG